MSLTGRKNDIIAGIVILLFHHAFTLTPYLTGGKACLMAAPYLSIHPYDIRHC